MGTMTCREYRRLLSDGLDGPRSKPEQEAFDAHGAACAPCLAHMKDAVVLQESLRGVAAVEEREDAAATKLPEALVQRILAAAKRAREDAKADARKKA